MKAAVPDLLVSHYDVHTIAVFQALVDPRTAQLKILGNLFKPAQFVTTSVSLICFYLCTNRRAYESSNKLVIKTVIKQNLHICLLIAISPLTLLRDTEIGSKMLCQNYKKYQAQPNRVRNGSYRIKPEPELVAHIKHGPEVCSVWIYIIIICILLHILPQCHLLLFVLSLET